MLCVGIANKIITCKHQREIKKNKNIDVGKQTFVVKENQLQFKAN